MLLLFTDIGLTKKAVGLGQTPTLCMEYIHTRVYVFLLIVHLPEISCFTRFSFMRVYVSSISIVKERGDVCFFCSFICLQPRSAVTVASPLPTVKLYEPRRGAVSNGVGLQLTRQLKTQ